MIRYVYLAGPYTKPAPNHNVHNAIVWAEKLIAHGFVPFVPHLTHLWDTVSPHPYEWWMTYDFNWVERCDALLRIPGESSGADREVEHATAHGLPVFTDLGSLIAARDLNRTYLLCATCGRRRT